jgi:hypothetical protein
MPASAVTFLGIIAAATLLMACVQVAVIVVGLRAAQRANALATRIEQDIKPLLANLTEVSQNAVRTSSLAAAQVERLDHLFADVTRRVDETLALAQAAIIEPAREGRAVMAAVRAAVSAFRQMRAARARARADDEDALFIG